MAKNSLESLIFKKDLLIAIAKSEFIIGLYCRSFVPLVGFWKQNLKSHEV